KYPNLVGIVDRCFRSQHVAMGVKLQRVMIQPVLNAFPFIVIVQTGFYARVSSWRKKAAPEKAEHIDTVIAQEGLTQPAVEPFFQCLLGAKDHIGGPFTFKNRPVVVDRHLTQKPRMQRWNCCCRLFSSLTQSVCNCSSS